MFVPNYKSCTPHFQKSLIKYPQHISLYLSHLKICLHQFVQREDCNCCSLWSTTLKLGNASLNKLRRQDAHHEQQWWIKIRNARHESAAHDNPMKKRQFSALFWDLNRQMCTQRKDKRREKSPEHEGISTVHSVSTHPSSILTQKCFIH